MSGSRAIPCFVLILRVPGQRDRHIILDSLSDVLEAAKTDARRLMCAGSVIVSPLIDVRRKA